MIFPVASPLSRLRLRVTPLAPWHFGLKQRLGPLEALVVGGDVLRVDLAAFNERLYRTERAHFAATLDRASHERQRFLLERLALVRADARDLGRASAQVQRHYLAFAQGQAVRYHLRPHDDAGGVLPATNLRAALRAALRLAGQRHYDGQAWGDCSFSDARAVGGRIEHVVVVVGLFRRSLRVVRSNDWLQVGTSGDGVSFEAEVRPRIAATRLQDASGLEDSWTRQLASGGTMTDALQRQVDVLQPLAGSARPMASRFIERAGQALARARRGEGVLVRLGAGVGRTIPGADDRLAIAMAFHSRNPVGASGQGDATPFGWAFVERVTPPR